MTREIRQPVQPTGMDGGGVIVFLVLVFVFLAGFGLGAWVF